MDMTALALITGLGWTSGIRFYAVLFVLGLTHRSGFYALPASLELLAHPWVLAVSGLLCLAEFFADKIPGGTLSGTASTPSSAFPAAPFWQRLPSSTAIQDSHWLRHYSAAPLPQALISPKQEAAR